MTETDLITACGQRKILSDTDWSVKLKGCMREADSSTEYIQTEADSVIVQQKLIGQVMVSGRV